jgi:hypothetical protein
VGREQHNRVMGRAIICGFFVATVCTVRAAAGEVCVVCSGPDATYRCSVDQASNIERYRGGERVLQLMCISELARTGGHTKCRVNRDASGVCVGEARTIGLTDLEAALAQGRSAPPGAVEGHETAAPVPGDPPKTVEELARRTTQASSEQLRKAGEVVTGSASSAATGLEKAGDAISGAVKKTWHCITSLFKQC